MDKNGHNGGSMPQKRKLSALAEEKVRFRLKLLGKIKNAEEILQSLRSKMVTSKMILSRQHLTK